MTTANEDGNEFRKPIDLGPVRDHRLNAVRRGLGPFITPEASDATLLALWKFALEPPQRYFDQKAAITVRDTLKDYAKKDGARLAEILEELKPRLDVAFYHLGAVNEEVDDGRWPEGGDPGMAQAVDERFIYRHLRLMEYVVDFLSLPIIAFHCEKRRRKQKTLEEVVGFRTGTRLKDHLPKTPIGHLAKFWRPVVRNASAHGGVSHTLGGLRFVDDSGNSEEYLYREFIRLTDRLLDACNGAALGYMAFLLQHPAPPSGSWPVPMAIAREALRGLLDQPDFRLVHLTSLTRGDNTRLLNCQHRFHFGQNHRSRFDTYNGIS